ncbi:Zinc finger C-x8-C-x5-C-x3-H type family protein [Raphanus sativus]|nr:Zinc finger C-x8-C-x5-C-x3-H type family protein [Raphanus sativus]
MDSSSHYNPSYGQWNSPYSPHPHPPPPPPLLPPPPPRQSYPDSPNFYVPSTHNGGQRHDYHHYSHRQDLPPNPAVDYPSSYYPPPPQQQQQQHHPPPPPPQQQHQPYIPQQVSYESQRVSQPSSSSTILPFTETRDVSQSAWVGGYKDKRVDSWTDSGRSRLDPSPRRDYQYDYGRSVRDPSPRRGLDGSSTRSRDEFRSNTGYVRKESRVEGSYQDRGQLKAESDRCFRGLDEGNRSLASRVGYGSDRYGVTVSRDVGRSSAASHEGTRNQRLDEGRILYPRKKDEYYQSEVEQYFDRGRGEESSESNRTPRKPMQKKSALLRLETPRNHQKGRENGRNHSNYNGKRFNSNSFRGKEHLGRSDRGLVERQRERTPVDLDVSFESNLLVAKPIASPASAGIHPSRSVTPRSIKARRALVPDKSENPSVTEGNGKRTLFSDEASVSEGSRPSKRQNISFVIEKKPDNHSTHSSSDAEGMNNVSFVDGIVQDCKVKITDRGPEALTRDSEAKIRSTVDAAEKISSFCEALKETNDDSNVEHDSNMGACSTQKDVIDGDKSMLKSQDVLDRTGCNAGEALPLKVMEMEDIVKASTNRSPTQLLLPLSTAADISEYSEAVIHFVRKSMCSVESHPCEDVDMDCSPSRNAPMEEVNTGFEERTFIGSSVGSLSYVDKDLEKSSRDASIYFNSENPGDQATAKLDIGGIEDGSDGINKNVDSLSPENDCRRGLVSSEIPSVSTELANANNSISGDLAKAHSSTIGPCANTIVDSPDMSESKNLTHCENTVNPSVENGSRKESMETTPLSSIAETADNLNSDDGKEAWVKGISSSLWKVDVKGSLTALPEESTDGYSRIDESDLAMSVSMENVSAERLPPDEGLGLASHHPAENPSVDQLGGSNIRRLKACLPVPNVSPNKDTTDGSSEGLVQLDVSQNDSTFCGNLPSSPALVIETNPAVGINGMSANETVTSVESGSHESQPCSTVGKFLPEDRRGCGSSGAFGSVGILAVKKNLEEDPSRVSACLVSDNSVSQCHVSPLMAMNEQIQNKESIQTNYSESQGGIMHEENYFAENIAIDTKEGKTNPSGGTSNCRAPGTDIVAVTGDSMFSCNSLSSSPGQSLGQIPSEIHVAATVDETYKDKQEAKHSGGTSEYRTQGADIVSFSGDSVQFDSPSHSPKLYRQIQSETHVASMVDDSNNYKEKAKPSDGTTKYRTPEADETSDVGGQKNCSRNSIKTEIFDGEALSADGKVSGTEILGDSDVHLSRSHSHADVKFALTRVNGHVKSVPDRDPQNKTSLSSRYELEKRKKKSSYSTQKSYPHSLPFVSDTKKNANPPNKHHTWHRKPSPAASSFVAAKPLASTLSTQQKFPIVTAQSSNSYVRKGNSLLRKPPSPGVTLGLPLSAIQLNRIENKSTGSASRVDVGNASFLVKAGVLPTLEKQSKPPSDSSTSKVSNAIVAPSGKCALSYSMDHLTTGLPESIMDSATSGEATVSHSGGDTSKTSDTPIQTDYASDCQQKKIPPKLDSSDLKRTVYVKRKANQLVAASDIHGTSRSQIPTSDAYFKRSKNQLVRTSESRVNHSPDDPLVSRASDTTVSERPSTSAFSDSAVTRPYKRSKFSLVWTQNDPQSGLHSSHMRYRRILPQLVPWKRVTYWRRLMNSVSALRNGSFSNISQKVSTMRKRHTVYTRSTNGYSLRKSKVLSIGGSHLKWSKSIERDSRKANEEATLAVAAFSKKENEKHSGQSSTRKTSRNHLARERIFRFGSLRYKMDSSRRTLQRISDEDSPCSGPTENGKGAKRPFIPKRLVIGYEEYVRVGNGNQLVRDPKKRTRALANEKVRWSLHNVRLRLAKKKKKYCQFFTRFGKCNKDDGKCPYVHDPSKVAVIPERMPDCSYFLQGLCNNEACPYRHVHVNPSAAICDGFLKGYCSDGDECRKKHSYTCPDFEATGSCSQGSKCKLHHPKNQGKGRKRKRPSEPSEKNARGRYFGSLQKLFSESEPMVVERRPAESEHFGTEGLEFISLGATEYEAGDNTDQATEQSISSESEERASIYDLIRPVALMR